MIPICSIGRNIKHMIDRPDEPYCFRLHKDRVYYVSDRIMRQAACVPAESLISLGTAMGRFTKSRKFHLKITCIDILAQFAKYKVWIKPSAEMALLYGHDVAKAGVARMTEGIPQYAGVILYSMTNTPWGFGRANHTTEQCKDLDPTAIAVLHQADIGEYLRTEEELL